MNKQEFIAWLEDAEGACHSKLAEDFMHTEEPDERWNKEYLEETTQLEGVKWELMDNYGGEDCGSEYYSVYKFTIPNGEEFAIRFDGYYASHYGTDYHGMREVQPRKKEITEWV